MSEHPRLDDKNHGHSSTTGLDRVGVGGRSPDRSRPYLRSSQPLHTIKVHILNWDTIEIHYMKSSRAAKAGIERGVVARLLR